MGCPYCGSGNWGYEAETNGSPQVSREYGMYTYIDRRAECYDCHKTYICREEYVYRAVYENLPMPEEVEE